MRPPRWRLRAMMVIVAVAAVSCGVVALKRRSQSLRDRAHYHLAASHQLEVECQRFFCGFGMTADRLEEINRKRAEEQRFLLAAAAYHRSLQAKYEAAARRPWLSEGADPPAPPYAFPAIVSADDY
jgi:hypothetical protein